jgi:hypothetical protein
MPFFAAKVGGANQNSRANQNSLTVYSSYSPCISSKVRVLRARENFQTVGKFPSPPPHLTLKHLCSIVFGIPVGGPHCIWIQMREALSIPLDICFSSKNFSQHILQKLMIKKVKDDLKVRSRSELVCQSLLTAFYSNIPQVFKCQF